MNTYIESSKEFLEFFEHSVRPVLNSEFVGHKEFDISFFREIILESVHIKNIPVSFEIKSPSQESEVFITPYSDLNFSQGQALTTVSLYEYGGIRFLGVITPFFNENPLQFIVVPKGQLESLVEHYENDYRIEETTHIIGTKHLALEREVIDFLTDEKLHAYCKEKGIKIKRGICLQGNPGCGKTLSLKWIEKKCREKDIYFRSFSGAKDFMENQDEFYKKKNAVFLFEDFDSFALEREENAGPNQVLQSLLNVLDGVKMISNVVNIFTTNHLTKIDDAMLRNGRIDKVYEFLPPTVEEIKEFLDIYLPDYLEYHNDIIGRIVKEKDKKLGFAHIKGICDDINLEYYYNNMTKPSYDKIKVIISDSIKRKNKYLETQRKIGMTSTDD